jgi:hypothetical protein
MERQDKNNREYYTIDVLHIVKTLWRRVWVIALCGLLAGAMGFSMAAFFIAPTYSSYIKLYVNNSSFSLGNTSFSISSSELTAAQSLVRTYGEILDSRSTLQRVIEKAEVDYSWKQLSNMIAYKPSNETEIMLVTVTWVFFRATSIEQAFDVLKGIVTDFQPWTLWSGELLKLGLSGPDMAVMTASLLVLLGVSLAKAAGKDVIGGLLKQGVLFRWTVYLLLMFSILIFGMYGAGYDASSFIYFQF